MSAQKLSLTVWNEASAVAVRDAIARGKALSKSVIKLAPKGFIATARKAHVNKLRNNSNVIIAALEQEGYRLEKVNGNFNPETKKFEATKTLRDGSEVAEIRLVKRPTAAVDEAAALAALGITAEQLAALKLANSKPAAPTINV
jgi:hypothetical protein